MAEIATKRRKHRRHPALSSLPNRPTAALPALALLAALLTAAPAPAWQTRLAGGGDDKSMARSVAIDAIGHVVVAATVRGYLGAARLDGADGRVMWQKRPILGLARAMDLDPAGNAVVVGAYDEFHFSSSNDRALVVFDSADGTAGPVYTPRDSGNHWLSAVAVDTVGRVFAGGSWGPGSGRGGNGHFYVARLLAGATAWERRIVPFEIDGTTGRGLATDVVVDAAGDVVAVGRVAEVREQVLESGATRVTIGGTHMVVVKLDGDDGSVLWEHIEDNASFAAAVALDGAGDVIVAGDSSDDPEATSGRDFAVLKLAGADGAIRWRYEVDGGNGGVQDFAGALAVDAGGDVYATGLLESTPSHPVFGEIFGGIGELYAVRLSGDDGTALWEHRLPNDVASIGFFGGVRGQGQAIGVDAAGNVVVAGTRNATWLSSGAQQAREFVVLKLDGATGDLAWLETLGDGEAFDLAIDDDLSVVAAGWVMRPSPGDNDTDDALVVKLSDCLTGRRLDLRDHADASRRRLKLDSKDRRIAGSIAGSSGDPSLHGARLVLVHPATMQSHTVPLPAAGWTARKGGYRYDGAGTCSKVRIKHHKKLAVRCGGSGLDLMGRVGALGSLAARLEVGAAGGRYCMQFGGQVRRNDGQRFEAKDAPAPTTCLGITP